jgi:diguanylate cyclase (GGDEF)-like protein
MRRQTSKESGGWWARLRQDYALAVLSLGGLVAGLWLAPFAIYRALQANWVAATSDTLLAIIFGTAAIYAWRSGDTRRPGWVMAIAIVAGLWAIGAAAQFAALFWAYPGVLMMFFLVPARPAALLGVLAVTGAAALSWQELGGTEGLPFFLVTNLLTGLFGFLVSQQADRGIRHWQTMSLVDALTGVGNRRGMELDLSRAFAAPASAGVLAVLDLDHFKAINDSYGHDEGDAVLRAFAATVQQALRQTDRLYRLGGEEFVLWLPRTDAPAAAAVLERIRQQVSQQVRVGDRAVTVSIGAVAHQPGQSWQACLAAADAALYRAKDGGRNQVQWG